MSCESHDSINEWVRFHCLEMLSLSLHPCAQAVFACHPSRAAGGALVFRHSCSFATLPQAFLCLLEICHSDSARDFFELCLFRLIQQITVNLPKTRVTQTRPSTILIVACKYTANPFYDHLAPSRVQICVCAVCVCVCVCVSIHLCVCVNTFTYTCWTPGLV